MLWGVLLPSLMPHDAFYLTDVVPSIPDEKIASFTYWGESIVIGTVSGKLLLYRVTGPPPQRPTGSRAEYASRRVASVEVSPGRPVTSVEAVPDLAILLALCDGAVSVHRLPSLDKRPSVLENKAAVSFALNAQGGRLCIVTGKK